MRKAGTVKNASFSSAIATIKSVKDYDLLNVSESREVVETIARWGQRKSKKTAINPSIQGRYVPACSNPTTVTYKVNWVLDAISCKAVTRSRYSLFFGTGNTEERRKIQNAF